MPLEKSEVANKVANKSSYKFSFYEKKYTVENCYLLMQEGNLISVIYCNMLAIRFAVFLLL